MGHDLCSCACPPVPVADFAAVPYLRTFISFDFESVPVLGFEDLAVLCAVYFVIVAAAYPLVTFFNRRAGLCVLALGWSPDSAPRTATGKRLRLTLAPAEAWIVGRLVAALRSINSMSTLTAGDSGPAATAVLPAWR